MAKKWKHRRNRKKNKDRRERKGINSAIVGGEDQLKRLLQGGVNERRSEEAYNNGHENPEAAALQELFQANYFPPPSPEEIGLIESRMQPIFMNGRGVIIIPMRERGTAIRSVLQGMTSQVDGHSIIVVDNGSDDEAVQEVHRYEGVTLIFQDKVLDVLKWERLLPILNLTERPRGKGVAVMAGYLFLYIQERLNRRRAPSFIIQSDAEIKEFRLYRCVEHLLYGVLKQPRAKHVLLAKHGRTNERTMSARSLLSTLSDMDILPEEVRARCLDLFQKLTPLKWMLSGEFLLEWTLAMRRLFATGYLEETLIRMFAADILEPGELIQVANENPRIDGANSDRKEAIMQQEISSLVLRMAFFGKNFREWNLGTIQAANHGIMAKPLRMGWIPSNARSVVAEVVKSNRIIPSIEMLDEENLIDQNAAERLIATK